MVKVARGLATSGRDHLHQTEAPIGFVGISKDAKKQSMYKTEDRQSMRRANCAPSFGLSLWGSGVMCSFLSRRPCKHQRTTPYYLAPGFFGGCISAAVHQRHAPLTSGGLTPVNAA